MFVRPWSKEAERVLKQLSKNGKAYSINPKLPREFGMKCKDIFHQDLLDVASIRNKKKRKNIFVTPPGIIVREQKKGFFFERFEIP